MVLLCLQVLKEATIVWKIARALHAVSDTRLSLILLCKYEAVTLLPYLVRAVIIMSYQELVPAAVSLLCPFAAWNCCYDTASVACSCDAALMRLALPCSRHMSSG